jgi:hypothetical protein
MADTTPANTDGAAKPADSGALWSLMSDLPYLALIVLGVIGVSWASISRTPSTTYWEVVTPLTALLCIAAGWRDASERGERVRMIVTQLLHWGAVFIGMILITMTAARGVLNVDAVGLTLLTLLALGTFTAGLNLLSWKLCLTGAFLALGVPMVAWVERAALLLFLIGAVLIALVLANWWFRERGREAGV